MDLNQKSTVDVSSQDFLQLYQELRPKLEKTVKRFFQCKADVDDMLQEIFMTGWSHFYQLRSLSSFSYWLQTIARRMCIRELSRQHRQWETLDPYDSEVSGILGLSGPMQLPDTKQNQIGMSFYFGGNSLREICQTRGLNRNTVLSHLRRFRQEMSGIISDSH